MSYSRKTWQQLQKIQQLKQWQNNSLKTTLPILAQNNSLKKHRQPKNDCADFSGVQETEEKSDNTADNSLENDFNFNAEPIDKKVFIVKEMLVAMAKNGRKTEAKEILTKNKVPALSKLCDAEEKILVKIYNEVKNAQ